jgi:hypothetical protein
MADTSPFAGGPVRPTRLADRANEMAGSGTDAALRVCYASMRCFHRTKSAASTAFFSVLTLVATGCGLSLAGELVADGGPPAEGQGSDDATVSIPDATDPGTAMGRGNVGIVGDADDPRTSPISDAAPPRSPLRDASDRDAREGAVKAGLSSKGTMACPPANDASTCDVGTSICCTCPNCSVPFPTTCLPVFPGCVPGGVYAALTCGSAANCPSGAECCASFDSTSTLTGSSCKSSCAVADIHLCADGAECAGGASCQALKAIPGFSGCL